MFSDIECATLMKLLYSEKLFMLFTSLKTRLKAMDGLRCSRFVKGKICYCLDKQRKHLEGNGRGIAYETRDRKRQRSTKISKHKLLTVKVKNKIQDLQKGYCAKVEKELKERRWLKLNEILAKNPATTSLKGAVDLLAGSAPSDPFLEKKKLRDFRNAKVRNLF
jgi:hypothetical protein